MARKRTRLEARNVVSSRDRIFVLIGGAVNDSVSHRPTVIGNVRAWLKYLLDRLFDHEGNNSSKLIKQWASCARSSAPFATAAAPGSGYTIVRRSNPRSKASAVRIACKSSGTCRGSF